ncbi:unnamed protein product [Adineta ricciae]|nr:unnamed protein product [Adineta ricciae]
MVVSIINVISFLLIASHAYAATTPSVVPIGVLGVEQMGENTFEGDMRFSTKISRGVGIRKAAARWTNGIVPYQFIPGHTADQQAFIVAVMRKMENTFAINNARCIQFRPKVASDLYYISIMNGTGCSSNVGMPSTPNFNHTVILQSSGCIDNGRIMHELLHTLGFFHEQSRPDRDSYVRVNTANIDSTMLFNFDKMSSTDVDTLNTSYDYESVMHYETTAFSKNGLPSIEPLQSGVKIGQRYYLSATDIQEVRMYYNCSANTPTLPPTTTAATTTNPSIITSTYSALLTANSPQYARVNGTSSNYYYETVQLRITTPGIYNIKGSSSLDSYGFLYTGTFDPVNPSVNLFLQNDDGSGDGQFSFNINFGSAYTLTIVVTTYNANLTGPISVIVTGPASATFARLSSYITTASSTTTTKAPTTTTTTSTTTTTKTTSTTSTTTTTKTTSTTSTTTTTKTTSTTSTTTTTKTTSTTTTSTTTTTTTTKTTSTTSTTTTTKAPTTTTTATLAAITTTVYTGEYIQNINYPELKIFQADMIGVGSVRPINFFYPSDVTQSICPTNYTWTAWFNEGKPANSNSVDTEDMSVILARNPTAMCRVPKSIQAQAINSPTNQGSGQWYWSYPNSSLYLLSFKSATPLGIDYRVRYCCPVGSFVAPVTTTTTPAPLSSSACGQQSTTPRGKAISRIVSGTNVIPNSWPWMLYYQERRTQGTSVYYGVCGATLISKDYAITAAQCIGTQNPADITLFAGMHDLSSSTEGNTRQARTAKSITIHPQYDSLVFANDIAVIRVNESFVFNTYVQPACLPGGEPQVGDDVVTVGWGATVQGGPVTNILQQTYAKVLGDCERWWTFVDSSRQMCVADYIGSSSVCGGDAGGPLLAKYQGRYVVSGITSFIQGCKTGTGANPNGFTRVTAYLNWIKSITG